MRLDYVLYAVGIVCFIITAGVAYAAAEQQLWIVIPIVVGFAFVGIGVTQRPKEQAPTQMAVAPPPPMPTMAKTDVPNVIQEVKVEEKKAEPPIITQSKHAAHELLEVKGIKDKRAQQLKAVGISTVEDLAKASATELAAKLKIAPYFTGKWIESAKQIVEKS